MKDSSILLTQVLDSLVVNYRQFPGLRSDTSPSSVRALPASVLQAGILALLPCFGLTANSIALALDVLHPLRLSLPELENSLPNHVFHERHTIFQKLQGLLHRSVCQKGSPQREAVTRRTPKSARVDRTANAK
jgi:hypothetical protein